MSSFWLCHWCARLLCQPDAGPHRSWWGVSVGASTDYSSVRCACYCPCPPSFPQALTASDCLRPAALSSADVGQCLAVALDFLNSRSACTPSLSLSVTEHWSLGRPFICSGRFAGLCARPGARLDKEGFAPGPGQHRQVAWVGLRTQTALRSPRESVQGVSVTSGHFLLSCTGHAAPK